MEKSDKLFCVEDVSFILGTNRYSFKKGNIVDLDIGINVYNHIRGNKAFVSATDEEAIARSCPIRKADAPLRIGIMRNGGYGDILIGTAVAKGIRRLYPRAFITWYTTPQFIQLLRGFPSINTAEVKHHYSSEHDYFKAHRYDFDMFFCTKPDAEVWYINDKLAKRYPNLLKHKSFKKKVYDSKASNYEWMVKQNKWWFELYEKMIGIKITNEDMWYSLPSYCDTRYTSEKYAVISSDGAGGTQVKSIPVTFFTKVVEHLIKLNYKVYQVGDRFTNKVPNAISLVGQTTISQAVGYIKNCDLYIGCDGFLTHIAAHYNVRNVCIYGPTPPKIWGHPNLNMIVSNYRCKYKPCWHDRKMWHSKCAVNKKLQGECMLNLDAGVITKKIDEVVKHDFTRNNNKRT